MTFKSLKSQNHQNKWKQIRAEKKMYFIKFSFCLYTTFYFIHSLIGTGHRFYFLVTIKSAVKRIEMFKHPSFKELKSFQT